MPLSLSPPPTHSHQPLNQSVWAVGHTSPSSPAHCQSLMRPPMLRPSMIDQEDSCPRADFMYRALIKCTSWRRLRTLSCVEKALCSHVPIFEIVAAVVPGAIIITILNQCSIQTVSQAQRVSVSPHHPPTHGHHQPSLHEPSSLQGRGAQLPTLLPARAQALMTPPMLLPSIHRCCC